MSRHKKRLQKSIHVAITDALHQLHNLEGDDRLALVTELAEWMFYDESEWDLESWLPAPEVEAYEDPY